jgi:hypothetical protein
MLDKDVFLYFWIEDKSLYLITKVCVQKVTEFKNFGFGRNCNRGRNSVSVSAEKYGFGRTLKIGLFLKLSLIIFI